MLAHGRRRAALGAAIATTLVAGCTSADTKNDYVDSVSEVRSTALATYSQTINATSADQTQLENAADTFGQVVADLRALDVPDEAQAGHQALVEGFAALETAFAQTAKRVDGADTDQTFAAMDRLTRKGQAISQQLDDAIEQLRNDLNVG